MIRYFGSAIVLLVAALLAGGCLQKEAVHTIYLSPDGAVRWTVDESGVVSDDTDPAKRLLEEQTYISNAVSGTHVAAQAFRAMAAEGLVRTSIVREERPYHVITDAQFSSIDSALSRFFKEAGLKASVTMKNVEGRTSVRAKLDFSKEPQDRGSPVLKMLEDLDDLRFVLTEGTFIAGGGFDVPDRMNARLSRTWMAAAEKAMEERREIELVLTWDPNGTD
jgi:hypothetical protein